MDLTQTKIKKFLYNIPSFLINFFGGHPKNYWSGFIIVFILAFIVIAAFNLYFFFSINSLISAPIDVSGQIQVKKVDKTILNKAAEELLEKEARFEEVLNGEMPADPSL